MDPYIGITDFATSDQIRHMLNVLLEHSKPDSKRRLHAGIIMSLKTLTNQPTKWEDVFPQKETIKDIFSFTHPRLMNCLHYADYSHDLDFQKHLTEAISYGGLHLNALQLDMLWPSPILISRAIKDSGKQLEVILQIGRPAFEAADGNPQRILDHLHDYRGVVQALLLDKSMGEGVAMESNILFPLIEVIEKNFPEFHIAVAGGLGPDKMYLLEPIVKKYSNISWDAQSQLRPSGNAMDPIHLGMAGQYVIDSCNILN